MIVVLWMVLIMIPIQIGAGIMTIIYKKNPEYEIGFSDCFITGLIACIGVSAVSHVLGLFVNLRLSQVSKIMLVFTMFLTAVSFVIALYAFFKNRFYYMRKKAREEQNKMLPLVFIIIVFLQMLFVFCMKAPVTAGDITLETIQSFLVEDGIYRVMPLTGMTSETGIPVRYKILCLPTLYAILSAGFGIDAELIVCHIVPIVVMGAAYLAYFRLGECLFGKGEIHKRYLFMIWVAIILTCAEGAVSLDGYAMLHAGYLGTSIRNLILIPYTLCAMLEKRYWKAFLCALAEVCIVWTFWGAGVCVGIILGMLILELFEKKIPKAGKFLQIFREKEEKV